MGFHFKKKKKVSLQVFRQAELQVDQVITGEKRYCLLLDQGVPWCVYVLAEKGIFTDVQNEGLCLKISMDPYIVLHIIIQKVIAVLKTVAPQ